MAQLDIDGHFEDTSDRRGSLEKFPLPKYNKVSPEISV